MMRATSKALAVRKSNILKTPARFTLAVERFHGRIAMVGLTTGGLLEHFGYKLPIATQLATETGLSTSVIGATVAAITTALVLEAVNPVSKRIEAEVPPAVFSNPGFTSETEILHGRIAMLAFAYVVLAERFTTMVL